jgi:hypothetical protein
VIKLRFFNSKSESQIIFSITSYKSELNSDGSINFSRDTAVSKDPCTRNGKSVVSLVGKYTQILVSFISLILYLRLFNLYAIEGYKHREIAEILKISVGTSKSQYSRARSLLQTKLKELKAEKISYEK